MTENVLEITAQNFDGEVLRSEIPVMVDFFAAWCGPCRMMAPIVEEIAKDNAGKLKVGKLDTESQLDVASRYGVMSIPTIIFFKDGKEAKRLVGLRPKAALQKEIDSL